MKNLYDMIFKRKSVRRYDESLHLSAEQLAAIEARLKELAPLDADIRLGFKIAARPETSCKIGEYCVLVYSEQKAGCLENVGYALEQLDLWLASQDIGACWYGWGKTPERELDGLKFVIMLAIGKCRSEDFRADYTKAKRKPLAEIWSGESFLDIAAARYAPSACNSQPWRVKSFPDRLEVFRSRDIQARLAKTLGKFYNKIDIGIFLCFLETALAHEGLAFERELIPEDEGAEPIPVAVYRIK